MKPEAIAALGQLNERLRQHLLQLEAESPSVPALSSQQVADLFDALLQAPAYLRRAAGDGAGGPEAAEAIAEFRRHFAKLQSLLPAIQMGLLAEKIRLEGERRHLRAAARWAQASKDSL